MSCLPCPYGSESNEPLTFDLWPLNDFHFRAPLNNLRDIIGASLSETHKAVCKLVRRSHTVSTTSLLYRQYIECDRRAIHGRSSNIYMRLKSDHLCLATCTLWSPLSRSYNYFKLNQYHGYMSNDKCDSFIESLQEKEDASEMAEQGCDRAAQTVEQRLQQKCDWLSSQAIEDWRERSQPRIWQSWRTDQTGCWVSWRYKSQAQTQLRQNIP